MLKILFAGLFVVSLLMAPARADNLEKLRGAKPDKVFEIQSEVAGRPFQIYVRLPENYSSSGSEYPVVYLLDGGFNYPMIAPYFTLASIDEKFPEVILVGIAYPSENFRSTDYTAPSPEREEWGGAAKFQQFLRRELLPKVEAEFRIDNSRRIIFGQSLAGQFVVYSAYTDPDLFWGRIASNPAFHRNLDFYLELATADASRETHLFIADAEFDAAIFKEPRNLLLENWKAAPPPWKIEVQELPGEYHAAAAPIAFRAGMRWLFPVEPETE